VSRTFKDMGGRVRERKRRGILGRQRSRERAFLKQSAVGVETRHRPTRRYRHRSELKQEGAR